MVHYRTNGHRPSIELESTDHPLAVQQRDGITLRRRGRLFIFMIRSEHRKPGAPVQSFAITVEDPIGPEARGLVEALCAEMTERYGRPPSPFSMSEAGVERSVFIIARRDGEPVACGAIRPLDDDMAELKRMYVVPAARREGFGRLIISALERHALGFGYKRVLLETGVGQPEAQRLYEACGYERVPPFGPYVGNDSSVCFQKML